jgi:hypothetical protein
MTAALAGGIKWAQKSPSVAGKMAILASGVALGAGAIVSKNVAGNLSENLGKDAIKSKLSSDSILSDLFNLTGNSVLDLLTLIQFFQSCQMYLLILIIYN